MKKTLTGFAIVLVAALWMSGSWAFFNSIANGAENPPTPPPATTQNNAKPATPPHHWRHHHWRHHHWRHHHRKCRRFHGRFWKKLDLTAAQKKEIKSIREQARTEMRPLIKDLRAGHDKLAALRKTGKFDEAKVRAIAEQQAKTLTNVIVDRESTMYKIRAVLTPEQRTKLDKMREKWKARHFRHWRDRGPRD